MTSRGGSGGGGLTPAGRIIIGIFVLGILGFGGFLGFKALSGFFGGDENTPASSNTPSNGSGNNGGNTGGNTSNPTATSTGNKATATPTKNNLPTIQVGTLGYGTYLSAIGARKFAADRGINIELVDLGGQEARLHVRRHRHLP